VLCVDEKDLLVRGSHVGRVDSHLLGRLVQCFLHLLDFFVDRVQRLSAVVHLREFGLHEIPLLLQHLAQHQVHEAAIVQSCGPLLITLLNGIEAVQKQVAETDLADNDLVFGKDALFEIALDN